MRHLIEVVPHPHQVLIQRVQTPDELAVNIRLYREALEKRPDFVEAHEAVARIYEQRSKPAWAAREREKTRAIPPLDCRSPSRSAGYPGSSPTRRSARGPSPNPTRARTRSAA